MRWAETRSENMVAMGHGRDQVHTFTIGGTRDGHVAGLPARRPGQRRRVPGHRRRSCPTFTRMMAPGIYDIARVETNARVVATNTMSVEAYRGAGRPEATAAIERAIDMFAAEIGMDAAEVRRRNLIANDAVPVHDARAAPTYDAGDYVGALDAALEAAGYDELRAEQARRRAERATGRCSASACRPTSRSPAAAASPASTRPSTSSADGTVARAAPARRRTARASHTSFATLVADRLGVPIPSASTVVHGDTDLVPRGGGHDGSRSLQPGGSALVVAAERARRAAQGARRRRRSRPTSRTS